MFDKERHILKNYKPSESAEYYISIDYGTLNPCSMGLRAVEKDKAVRLKEYYYDGRKKGVQRTDEDYCAEPEKLADGFDIQYVIIDPSAASFIAAVKNHGKFRVRKAGNDVLNSIRSAMNFLNDDKRCFVKNAGIQSVSSGCTAGTKSREKTA